MNPLSEDKSSPNSSSSVSSSPVKRKSHYQLQKQKEALAKDAARANTVELDSVPIQEPEKIPCVFPVCGQPTCDVLAEQRGGSAVVIVAIRTSSWSDHALGW